MSLPSKHNPKVLTIKETTNLDSLKKVQLRGSLKTYEMRITKGKVTSKEVALRETRQQKKRSGHAQGLLKKKKNSSKG